VALGVMWGALTMPGLAHAQSAEEQRRAWIDQAWTRRRMNEHAAALDLALRAGEVRMVPQLRRFIAEEQVATGALVDAWNSAVRCVREVEAGNASQDSAQTGVACRRLLVELAPRVARVEVRAPQIEGREVTVRLAGRVITPGRDPIGVEAGPVRVEAEAPGRLPFSRDVIAVAGRSVDVVIELAAPPTVVTQRSLAPWVVVGAGAAVMVGGGVLGALYVSARAEIADSACVGPTQCPEALRSLKSRGELFGTLGVTGLALGGALVAGGITWWVLSRRDTPAAPQIAVVPMHHGIAVGISGTF
jgi:hypothetical protein